MQGRTQREHEYHELGYNAQAFDQHVRAVSSKREQEYLRSLQTGFMDGEAQPSAPTVLMNTLLELERCNVVGRVLVSTFWVSTILMRRKG